MRTLLLALVIPALVALAGCHSSSLPAGGDGGGGTGGGGTGGSGGGTGKPCAVLCTMGFICCDGQCVNTRNDIRNCGACGNACTAPDDFCDGQKCAPPPCSTRGRWPARRPCRGPTWTRRTRCPTPVRATCSATSTQSS